MTNGVQMIDMGNYYPIGDIIVIALCLVVVILVQASFVKRTRSFVYFAVMIIMILIAAYSNIVYHFISISEKITSHAPIYIFKHL